MTRKEQLEETINTARAELNKIEDAESYERNSALVGKCYKYRNSYSCPERPQDYWWLYVVVTGLERSSLNLFMFERDINGKIEIKRNHVRSYLAGGYQEIERSELLTAWREIVAQISSVDI